MSASHTLVFGFYLCLVMACGQDNGTPSSGDCRTVEQACPDGSECTLDEAGDHICTPTDDDGSTVEGGADAGLSGAGGQAVTEAGDLGTGGTSGGQTGSAGVAGDGEPDSGDGRSDAGLNGTDTSTGGQQNSGGESGFAEGGQAGDVNAGGEAGQDPYCGDGIINGTETCDDGNDNNSDDCTNDCQLGSNEGGHSGAAQFSLTFNVRMPQSYSGGVTVGNNIQGWNTAGMVQLRDDDGNGIYSGSMLVTAGQRIEFKYIKGYDGSGIWEDVPTECGYVTGPYSNRSLLMPAQDVVLPAVAFGTCETEGSGENNTLDDVFSPSDISGDCSPTTRRIRFRVNAKQMNLSGSRPCVFGTFNNWNADQYPMTDSNGDDIYEIELSVSTAMVEYKFKVCGQEVYENLPDQNECTLRTGDFVNRVIPPGMSDEVRDAHCFGTCGACGNEDPTAFVHPWSICADLPGRSTPISVAGRRMMEASHTLHLKGVAWQPYGIGQGPGVAAPPWSSAVEQDANLMISAGINAVRTYGVISDRAVLDHLYEQGISVLMTVFYGYGDTAESAISHVCALKDHPAIIGWLVGNEWNLNMLGRNVGFEQAADAVEQVVRAIRMNDSTRPVSTIYGGLPNAQLLNCMSEVQTWGLNVYTGASFGDLFEQWATLTTRPMYFGEYGADAYDSRIGAENEALQADLVESLTREIHAQSARANGVCSGGMVFEFSDEWWKYANGNWAVHDTANSWENGAYPDPGMQEEWWGLVRIDRTPREALNRYGSLSPPN